PVAEQLTAYRKKELPATDGPALDSGNYRIRAATKEANMTARWQRKKGDLDRRLALKLALLGASALLVSKGGSALAADGEKKGQTTVIRLLENERLEVVRMVSAPGDKGAMRER